LVISDEGAVYRGAHAWIMCLWALENYREHAQRMAHPILLPFARIVCELLSGNRFFLSDALFRQEPQNTARLLAAHHPRQQASCSTTGALLWKLSLPAAAVRSVRSFAALFPPRAMKS
jgi:hypothetical protein